jgi:hypothetical protein
MSLMTALLAFLALPAGRKHTSSVEEKINKAENDALDLAAIIIDLKLDLEKAVKAKDDAEAYVGEANRQRENVLQALVKDRDALIALRRENADLVRQRDYAFEQTRIARRQAWDAWEQLAGRPPLDPAAALLVATADQQKAQADFAQVRMLTPTGVPFVEQARVPPNGEFVLPADVVAHCIADEGVFQLGGDGGLNHIPLDLFRAIPAQRPGYYDCTCVPARHDVLRAGR